MNARPQSGTGNESGQAPHAGAPVRRGARLKGTAVAMVLGLACTTAALAGPPADAGRAAPIRPAGGGASPPAERAARALAAALQETNAGGEQIHCAADLQPPHRSLVQHLTGAPPRLQARASAPGQASVGGARDR